VLDRIVAMHVLVQEMDSIVVKQRIAVDNTESGSNKKEN
ncbi:hypothetical protein Tco_1535555, partial [Tanacetum coccineum]